MRFIAALISQLLSYSTSLSAALFFMQPDTDLRWWIVVVLVAAAFEALFFGMKEAIFAKGAGNKLVGVLGFFLDGLVNTAGIMALAIGARLLTFGPVPAMLGSLDVDLARPDERLLVSLGVSFFLGMILSITPHILWRVNKASARAAAAA